MSSARGEFRHQDIPVGDVRVHVMAAGDPTARPFVFLHGWPESARTWEPLIAIAATQVHAVAVDLPGIGLSTGAATDGSKRAIATVVHDIVSDLGLTGVTLVGHDIGGMVAYAYLRAYSDLARAVIMNVPVPGVPPWDEFVRAPFLWHFALHAVPALPERLVHGRQREYFDYFYDLLSANPTAITSADRKEYVDAYVTDGALTAGFDWYRAFSGDAEDNIRAAQGPPTGTPLLYLRGERERGGDIAAYVDGFEAAGVSRVQHALVAGAGHFSQLEDPEQTWQLIADFADTT